MDVVEIFPVINITWGGLASVVVTVSLLVAVIVTIVAFAAKAYAKGGHIVLGLLVVATASAFAESWWGNSLTTSTVLSYWGIAAIWAGIAGVLYFCDARS